MRNSNVVRKMLCLVLIVAALATAVMPAFASNKGSGAYVVTNTDGERLIVHATASQYGVEVARLKPGTVVVYKSKKEGWWKVSFYGGSGYVDRKFLTSVTNLPSAKYKAIKKIPVYSKARTSSAYLGKLKTNKKVSIVKKSGDWVRIRLSGVYGWTKAIYLRRVS